MQRLAPNRPTRSIGRSTGRPAAEDAPPEGATRSRAWAGVQGLGLAGSLLVVLGGCARGAGGPAGPSGEAGAAEVGAPEGAAPVSASAGADAAAVPLEGVAHPGCFMLLELGDGPPRVAGEQPCEQQTTPASTFKIPHALIALDTGVVKDPDAKAKWDGKKGWSDAWNRDHSLRTAIYESVVWFFQGTARAIGEARMREYLTALDYGNAKVEGAIDMFWLDEGSLRISGEEQLDFMARLYRGELTRGEEHVPMVREMLVRPVDSYAGRVPEGTVLPKVDPALVFSAKTGTGSQGDSAVTWLVGHVACPGREHVFVSRVIAPGEPDVISPAVEHGLAALDRTGVLRCKPASPRSP
jgi:beta-lactamase class D